MEAERTWLAGIIADGAVSAALRQGDVAAVKSVSEEGTLTVEAAGDVLTVSALALDQPTSPGDWVLVHSGFALARLDPSDPRDVPAILTGNWEDAGP